MDNQVATCQMLLHYLSILIITVFLQVAAPTSTVLDSRVIFVVLEVLWLYHVLCTVQLAPFK